MMEKVGCDEENRGSRGRREKWIDVTSVIFGFGWVKGEKSGEGWLGGRATQQPSKGIKAL